MINGVVAQKLQALDLMLAELRTLDVERGLRWRAELEAARQSGLNGSPAATLPC